GSKGAIEQFARSLSRVKNRIAILSVSDNNRVTGRRARNRFAIGWVQPRSGVLSIATRLPLPVGRVAVSCCGIDLQCEQETATRPTGIADFTTIDRTPLRGFLNCVAC